MPTGIRLRSAALSMTVAVLMVAAACSDPVTSINEPVAGVHLDAAELVYFSTADEMALAADAVVVAVVTDIRPGRILDDSGIEGEDATQVLDVTLTIERVLSGTLSSDKAVVEWLGWEIDGLSGEPEGPFIVNGIRPPLLDDRSIWFLRREEGDVDGAPRYGLVSFDGLLHVAPDGTLSSPLDDDARLGHRFSGTKIAEFETLLEPKR